MAALYMGFRLLSQNIVVSAPEGLRCTEPRKLHFSLCCSQPLMCWQIAFQSISCWFCSLLCPSLTMWVAVYGTTAVFAQFPILALTSVLLQWQLVCPCTCVPVACVDKARGMVTSQDSCRVVRLCCNDLGNLWCPIYSTHKMGLIRK